MEPGPIYSDFLLLCLQVENVFFLAKWSLAPFILGQKQRVFLPYSLSLSSMVATGIPQNLGLSSHLSWIWRRFR